MADYRWIFKTFDGLSTRELFDLLRLRCEVFIVEQNCPYPDPDKKDLESWHMLVYEGSEAVATLRLVKPGISYKEASIGRVCTSSSQRRTGLGRELMKQCLQESEKIGWLDIRISAQHYLEKFYSDFGFVSVSDPYMEDNIPHIEMLLKRS